MPNNTRPLKVGTECQATHKSIMENSGETVNDEAKLEKVTVADFDWPAYLEANNLEATPEGSFVHVEASLDSGVREGMVVERPREDCKGIYWLATIENVFGPLLKLFQVGDPARKEIWHDLSQNRLFPLGWCQMNKAVLEPPEEIKQSCPQWQSLALQYLEDVSYDTISMHHIDGDGVLPGDRIKQGMVVDVRDKSCPLHYWPATIVDNHGGLLTLQYVSPAEQPRDYLFYLSDRLAEKGFGIKFEYVTPSGQKAKPAEQEMTGSSPPDDLISGKMPSQPHELSHPMAFEIIHPVTRASLEKCMVDKAISDHYFSARLVDQPDVCVTCSMNSTDIFPSGTSKLLSGVQNKEGVLVPNEKFPVLESAHELGFEKKQKLLVMLDGGEFHSATIKEVVSHLLVLQVDDGQQQILASVHDYTLFPLSWCTTNAVGFKLPKCFLPNADQPTLEATEEHKDDDNSHEEKVPENDKDGSWCPPIYFNYKCYSASFLSRARLASLPKSVGPGPVQLVMREVLNLIIGSSFKSGSVLKRLETKRETPPAYFVTEELKGKSRVLNLKANVEIPTKASQVQKYLREMCQKVSACPNLVATRVYDDICPANCHSRPRADFRDEDSNNGSSTSTVPRRKQGTGRKRRHPDALLVESSRNAAAASPSTSGDDGSEGSSSRPTSPIRRQRRTKEWESILPKSEIRTRGAKLPNFRIHMKIRPSVKDRKDMEKSSLRASFGYGDANSPGLRRKGRKKELPPAFTMADFPPEEPRPPPIRIIRLADNPDKWSAKDTARFLAQTADCAQLARFALEDAVDGRAFMLLNYPTVMEYWRLKPATAIKLCRHIESVRLAHATQYCN